MKQGVYHVPVMLKEVLEGLKINPSGTYVDCTFGGGGHSLAILELLNEKGRLVVFDQDETAKKNVPDDSRLVFIPHNFRHLQRFLRLHKIRFVDGIIADLGVSSHQFDVPERGFSIRFDSPLDMRMDQKQELTALKILRDYSEGRLHKLFEQFGEVTNSKTLARIIVQGRNSSPVNSIREFRNLVHSVVKGNPNRYFAQVFQALRIEVNDEFGALMEMLKQVTEVLRPGGRIVIITFHSLEDRVVKKFYKTGTFEEVSDELYGNKQKPPFIIITKKPLIPSPEEIEKNSRARSAKLRIAERC